MSKPIPSEQMRAALGAPGDDGCMWCGPAAVAWLAGLQYREALAAVECTAQRRVRGFTYTSEIVRTLASLHLLPEPCAGTDRLALVRPYQLPRRRALRTVAAVCRTGDYLVRVGGHFVVLRNGRAYDNRNLNFDPAGVRWIATHLAKTERN